MGRMRSTRLGCLAVLLLAATGCSSSKITDAYMARDTEGIRITSCFRPDWSEINAVVELVSFREDTLLTPALFPDYFEPSNVVVGFDEAQVLEYGGIATGKGELKLPIPLERHIEPPPDPLPEQPPPWPTGHYRLELYLDEFVRGQPDQTLEFEIAERCPCRPFPDCRE